MSDEANVLATEQQFFRGLIEADKEALDRVLTDDFVLVDVIGGSEISKEALLTALAPGPLAFEAVEQIEAHIRFYQTTAIVIGSTRMQGRFGDAQFAVHSRYTHVYVEQDGRWRLASAQGTQIAE